MGRRAIAKIFIVSAIIGLIIGLAADLFIRAIQNVDKLIWTSDALKTAQDKPWLVIVVSLIGGIIMGICVKYFGTNDEGIGFEAVMVAFKKDGAIGLKQIKRVVLNAYTGLVTGASIGPESPLMTLGGFCGDFLARWLKVSKQQLQAFIAISLGGSIGVLVDSPVAGPILFSEQPPTQDANANRLLVFTSMVAASIGFGLYYLLGAPLFKGTELVPAYYGFKFVHLFYALLVGVVGAAIGFLMKYLILKIRRISHTRLASPIIRGTIVGLIVGVLAAFFPLIMFDGSKQLGYLVAHTAQYSIIMLLTLALVRLASTAVALGGGYQGGNIFPTIFIAGATGLAIHAMFHVIPASVAMVACMASAMYVFIPMPLFAIFLFTEISSFSLIPFMAMGLVTSYLITALRVKTDTSGA